MANPNDLGFLGSPPSKQVHKPYQSRIQRTTSDIADPNDLSFLGARPKPSSPAPARPPPTTTPAPAIIATSAPAPPRPAPGPQRPSGPESPSQPLHNPASVEAEASTAIREDIALERAQQAGSSLESAEELRDHSPPTAIRSPEDLVQDALALSALATAKKQKSGVFMRGASMLDDYEVANRTLIEALTAMNAQLQTQAQQQSDMMSLHRQEKKSMQERHDQVYKTLKETRDATLAKKATEVDKLRDRLNTAVTTTNRLNEDKVVIASNVKRLENSNRSLVARNDSLQKDLDKERDPALAQAKRLSRLQETRLEQEEKDRQQKEKDSRRAQRATYHDFQDFFQQGSRDVRRWLRSDVKAHTILEQKAANYWNQAAESFESFVEKTIAKDDFCAWDLKVASRHLEPEKAAENLQEFENRTMRRNDLFEALSNYMQTQARESIHAREELADLVWGFENSTWDNLKVGSHDVRHFARILRFSGDKSPQHMAHQYFVDSQSIATEIPLRQLNRNTSQELRALKRAVGFEKDPERLVYLRKRVDAVNAQTDLLTIIRELSLRHTDLVKADWLRRESLVHTAFAESIEPLIAANAELRVQIERRVQIFADLGLDRKQWFLKYNEVYNTRKLIDELDRIIYRNHVLFEHHGRLDDAEVAKLKAIPLRRYQESMGYLKVLLGSSGDHGIRAWAMKITERHKIRQQSGVSILGHQEDPLNLTTSPTPRDAGLTKKERRAGSRKLSAKESTVEDSNSSQGLVRRVTSNEYEDAIMNAVSKEKVVHENDEDFFSDSPMDAFETPSPEKSGGGGSIETSADGLHEDSHVTPTDIQSFLPTSEEAVKTVPSLPKPSYKKSAQPPSRHMSRGVSAAIQPQKGVLPKPDFGTRRRPRLSFKSIKPRKHSFHTQSSSASETALAAEREVEAGKVSAAAEEEASTAEQQEKDSADILSSPPKEKEVHVALKYQIPEQSFKAALMASSNSGASFWKHSLYRGPAGETIKVHYCARFEAAEREAKALLDEGFSVVGFDMEWEEGSRLEIDGIKRSVSLIQIACESRVVLFQIASFYGKTTERLMPPSLRTILESPNIVKTGVNIAGDYTRLRKCFDIQGQGLFELSHLFKVVKYGESEPTKVDKMLYALASQVQETLFLPLEKGMVRTSSWSLRLNQEQVQYAASDAYAGFRLYDALEAKRKLMDPTPPRPAFYELRQPLILGNGKPPPPKKKAVAAKTVAKSGQAAVAGDVVAAETEGKDAVAEAADEDEVAAAEEALDEAQEENEEAKESEDEFYSCESDYEDKSEAEKPPPRPPKSRAPKKPSP